MCAERVALGVALSTLGFSVLQKGIVAMAVVAGSPSPIIPCGACLQVVSELNTEISVICGNLAGTYKVYSLSELLPAVFRL